MIHKYILLIEMMKDVNNQLNYHLLFYQVLMVYYISIIYDDNLKN